MTEGWSIRDPRRLHHLVTPSAVKAILSKIEAAQLKRAQEDISIQLSDILVNVNGVLRRFQEDLGSNMKKKKISRKEQEKGKKRFVLLEKIASFSKAAETKERNLFEILNWMSDWGDSLSHEIKPKESEKECEKQDEWMEVMERVLPLSLIATEGGIESLISLCYNLIEEQKKRTLRPKGSFWKAWREKILYKSSSSLQPLSPEQILKDKNTTKVKVGEIQAMLQEFLDSVIFNKGEIKAIKYISTMVENLNHALILQFQENHKLETQYKVLEVEILKEIKNQKLLFQKEFHALEVMQHALEIRVQESEQKYQQLLKEAPTEKDQLQMGGGDGDRRDLTKHISRPLKSQASKKMSLPPIEEALDTEMEQKPEKKKEQSFLEATQFFPNTKTKDLNVDMRDNDTALLKQLPPRIFSSEDSEDMGIHAENTIDSKYKVTASKPTGYQCIDYIASEEVVAPSAIWLDEDFPRETWGDLLAEKPPKEKTGLSQEQQVEEERHWQERRKQWQAEEKQWQEQQKKWQHLEREHKEKQQQWKQEEEELKKKRQEYINFKLLMKLEEQKLEQNRETYMSLSPYACKRKEKGANLMSRAYHSQSSQSKFQTPWIYESQLSSFGSQESHQGSMKLGVFSYNEMPVKSFPSISSILQKKRYSVDVQGQRKNVLLLNNATESLGLPIHLHSQATKLIMEMLYTNITRFQYLIQKYNTYKMFQDIRQDIISHIKTSLKTGNIDDGPKFYNLLEKIDKYQNCRLQIWTEKQKVLDQNRGDYLQQMMSLFSQLQGEWDLNLNTPFLIISPEKQKKADTGAVSKKYDYFIRADETQLRQSPVANYRRYPEFLKITRQRGQEIEAIWKTDVSVSSYPIKEKTPAGVTWSQIDGYPDFPRMVEFDFHHSYNSPSYLNTLRTRTSFPHSSDFSPTSESWEITHQQSNCKRLVSIRWRR
ncbi:protein FAM186B isoform X2 [Macrotis lagotis]|uniref:protein FAM186B isoform X2 n=1 Tax=Macrotis lagotis TaxID=92651 RepID=UPI003D6865D2